MNIAHNTNRKPSAMGRSRDFGLNHGAGKGDAPRYNPNEHYRASHEAALPYQPDVETRFAGFTQIRPGVFRRKY